jgi:hypothetical protein
LAALLVDGVPIPFTARGSYQIELNPNGKRKWTMEIYAGDTAHSPSKYNEVLAMLTSGIHVFTDEEGVEHNVRVTENPLIVGVFNSLPVISAVFSEEGFGDDSGGAGYDPTITGVFGGVNFTAKLSNVQKTMPFAGSFARSVNGRLLSSAAQHGWYSWQFAIPQWEGRFLDLVIGDDYSFEFEYTDHQGRRVRETGTGKLTTPPSMSGGQLSLSLEYDAGMPAPTEVRT